MGTHVDPQPYSNGIFLAWKAWPHGTAHWAELPLNNAPAALGGYVGRTTGGRNTKPPLPAPGVGALLPAALTARRTAP